MGFGLQVRYRARRTRRYPHGEAQMTTESGPQPTPSQTVGPFFHDALLDEDRSEPVSDAIVEIWQANQAGRYNDPKDDRGDLPLDPETFSGFGRSATDSGGRFSFVTVKPGPVPGPDGEVQAPHIMVSVFARGLLKRVVTRLYFPNEEEANANDPILSSIEDLEFRRTLLAYDEGDALRFDIHLQGENQTAFFEL